MSTNKNAQSGPHGQVPLIRKMNEYNKGIINCKKSSSKVDGIYLLRCFSARVKYKAHG